MTTPRRRREQKVWETMEGITIVCIYPWKSFRHAYAIRFSITEPAQNGETDGRCRQQSIILKVSSK